MKLSIRKTIFITSMFFATTAIADETLANTKIFNATGTGQNGGTTDNSSGPLTGNITIGSGMYNWTIPYSGIYQIEARGAQGGISDMATGGKGAIIKGEFNLLQNDVLRILVGQAGNSPGAGSDLDAGGGGGTFVVKKATSGGDTMFDGTTVSPLIIAGGGGGDGADGTGQDGSATQASTGYCPNNSLGQGGSYNATCGSPGYGGGYFTSGSATNSNGYSGLGFLQGGTGGGSRPGGFGGGAGGTDEVASGGGGYTGGIGYDGTPGAGGGGSYNIGANQTASTGQLGNGVVNFTLLNPYVTLNSPADNSEFPVNVICKWNTNSQAVKYQIVIEQKLPTDSSYSLLQKTDVGTNTSYTFNVPNGTPINTVYRWSVESYFNGAWQPAQQTRVIKMTGNKPQVTASFTTTQSDFSTSLVKTTMAFSIDSVVDPDDFNYVKLFADVEEVSGTKKQLETNLAGPVSWTKKNYKLKLIPNLNTYDLLVVDAADENIVIATLIDDKPIQNTSDTSPESLTFRIYVEDYQTSDNTKQFTSDYQTISITVDTRNNLPIIENMSDDVHNKIMSSYHDLNSIRFSGQVRDVDKTDSIKVYYTVKSISDKVSGKYQVNPTTDTLIKDITNSGTSITATFSQMYLVPDTLINGDYVILVYGIDQRGGIGDLYEIPFKVNRTVSLVDIIFQSSYGGTPIATPEKRIVAKDSILKLYFTIQEYSTFEYAIYQVDATQQTEGGSFTPLNIRGAFTNDVAANFIGIDLSNPMYKKGDVLVIKFRATTVEGAIIQKSIRVLIGDENNTISQLDDTHIPTQLQ